MGPKGSGGGGGVAVAASDRTRQDRMSERVTGRNLHFDAPSFFNATRVKENWFSLALIVAACCHTGRKVSCGKFGRFLHNWTVGKMPACCPQRVVGRGQNLHASEICRHPRRAEDSSPHLQTRGRFGQDARPASLDLRAAKASAAQIGRASCRERV